MCPDENDLEYFALALKLRYAIWSQDKTLKQQQIIRIYSTEELNKMF
jgi:predicted nucleic acid-binding protein